MYIHIRLYGCIYVLRMMFVVHMCVYVYVCVCVCVHVCVCVCEYVYVCTGQADYFSPATEGGVTFSATRPIFRRPVLKIAVNFFLENTKIQKIPTGGVGWSGGVGKNGPPCGEKFSACPVMCVCVCLCVFMCVYVCVCIYFPFRQAIKVKPNMCVYVPVCVCVCVYGCMCVVKRNVVIDRTRDAAYAAAYESGGMTAFTVPNTYSTCSAQRRNVLRRRRT